MSPDMSDRSRQAIPGMHAQPAAAIRLRTDRFLLMTRLLGCESNSDRARLIGVDEKSIRRAKQGIIGQVFMAKTVVALRPARHLLAKYGLEPSLDDLFEVVEVATPPGPEPDLDDLAEQVA